MLVDPHVDGSPCWWIPVMMGLHLNRSLCRSPCWWIPVSIDPHFKRFLCQQILHAISKERLDRLSYLVYKYLKCPQNLVCFHFLLVCYNSTPGTLQNVCHLLLNLFHLFHGVHWGTMYDFTTSFFHFFSVLHCPLGRGELQACPFPDVLSQIFLYLPCLLPPFTVPC